MALVLMLLAASSARAQNGPVQYGYDELGRLIIVIDGAGNAAIYNYDAVGNLLSIQRINASDVPDPVTIFAVSPTRGKVGSTVSILGKGFGATPGQNSVSFTGGATAAVVSASPTGLRVTVPASAQDGPISVTAPAGSATSAQSFRVIGPMTVTPTDPSISAGTSRQFSATGPGGSAPAVTWAVNDIVGGSANGGTISSGGLYVAPAYLSQQTTATITAIDQSDPTARGSVTVTIVPRRLAAAAQGVSVSFAPGNVTNSVQASVSAVVGGTTVTKSLQTSVSAVIGGNQVTKNLHTSVSAVIGGDPVATAATAMSVSLAPVITGVSPATGVHGATNLTVTLTGVFNDATEVTFVRNNALDTLTTASIVSISPDGTQATLQVSIAAAAAIGDRVVRITTPAGTSTVVGTGANVFTVQ